MPYRKTPPFLFQGVTLSVGRPGKKHHFVPLINLAKTAYGNLTESLRKPYGTEHTEKALKNCAPIAHKITRFYVGTIAYGNLTENLTEPYGMPGNNNILKLCLCFRVRLLYVSVIGFFLKPSIYIYIYKTVFNSPGPWPRAC